jgi:hypothetical protein
MFLFFSLKSVPECCFKYFVFVRMVPVIKVPSLCRAVHKGTAVVIHGGVMVIMLAIGHKVCGFEPANLELVLLIMK